MLHLRVKNIKVVYMPKSNSEDLENVPKLILDNMEVIPVSNFNEVYTKLFKDYREVKNEK